MARIQDRWPRRKQPRRHRSLEAHANRIHVDACTATAAMVILAGIITLILALATRSADTHSLWQQ